MFKSPEKYFDQAIVIICLCVNLNVISTNSTQILFRKNKKAGIN